ncbi:MAG: hypothetical protein U1D30_12455 [Planctomycetota bacterium]
MFSTLLTCCSIGEATVSENLRVRPRIGRRDANGRRRISILLDGAAAISATALTSMVTIAMTLRQHRVVQ